MVERLVPKNGGCSYQFSRDRNYSYEVGEWSPYLTALAFNLGWAYETERNDSEVVLYSEKPMPEVISDCL